MNNEERNTTTRILPAGAYYSDKFEYVNQKLRQHFQLVNDEIENVKEKVNELVAIVHNDNKDWSIKKICDYIAGRNDDLEEFGFSARTIYNYLNDENRKLIDTKKQKGKKLENNVTGHDDEGFHHNILEDSSMPYDGDEDNDEPTTDTFATAIEIKDTETEPETIIDQLPKPVVKLAEKIELSPNKLRLIANPRLKEHPELQKGLAESISPLSLEQAKIKVAQKIRDLETGYIVKEGDSYVYSGDTDKRDIIKCSKTAVEFIDYLGIMKNAHNFLESITGHKLEKGEHQYTKEIVDNTKEYRYKIAKSCNGDIRELNSLFHSYEVIRRATTDMVEILSDEMNVAQKKRDMMKK